MSVPEAPCCVCMLWGGKCPTASKGSCRRLARFFLHLLEVRFVCRIPDDTWFGMISTSFDFFVRPERVGPSYVCSFVSTGVSQFRTTTTTTHISTSSGLFICRLQALVSCSLVPARLCYVHGSMYHVPPSISLQVPDCLFVGSRSWWVVRLFPRADATCMNLCTTYRLLYLYYYTSVDFSCFKS